MSYRIIPRSEWGARHDRGAGPAPLPASEVWLHHSVTIAPDLVPPFDDDYAAIRTLEQIGENRFGRGISYTFPITPAGLIFEGHGIDRRGAHTAGHNTAGRAICFVGNYETHEPTEAQIDAAGWLLAHGFLSGWWKAAKLKGGHRDVKVTSCPGRHAYAAMARIDAAAARHARGAGTLPPAPVPAPAPSGGRVTVNVSIPLLRQGDRGPHVEGLQGLLNAKGDQGLAVDGDFGPATERAVRNWQAFFSLGADGVVGEKTWTSLLVLPL